MPWPTFALEIRASVGAPRTSTPPALLEVVAQPRRLAGDDRRPRRSGRLAPSQEDREGRRPKAAGARLSEFRSGRMVHDKDSAIGECLHRVAGVARNDRNDTRSHDVRESVHLHLELTGNDLVHFFLGMEVLVDRRSRCEFVIGESHGRRVEEAAPPARQALDNLEAGRIQKRHQTSLAHNPRRDANPRLHIRWARHSFARLAVRRTRAPVRWRNSFDANTCPTCWA
jgi:hypothetical protein